MNRTVARAAALAAAAAALSLALDAPAARASCGLAPPADGTTVADEPATVYYGGSPDSGGGFAGADADRASAEAGAGAEGAYVRGQAARAVYGEASASPDGAGVCVNDYTPPNS